MITVALPKGRLLDATLQMFGIEDGGFEERRLSIEDEARGLRFIAVKPWDVPVYVEYGTADLGVAGGDVVVERGADVYVPLRLGFGGCRMVVAAKEGASAPEQGTTQRVATKYPRTATRWFSERGIPVYIVDLQGSVELAPVLGLSDRIVDLVETGKTLEANGLVVEHEIESHQAQLIVCRSSLITQTERIQNLIESLKDT